MTRKVFALSILPIILTLALLLAYSARGDLKPFVVRLLSSERSWFVADPLPMHEIHQIFDMGIVDANQDGHLDIYTSNHNYQQVLWIADGRGGYSDKLSEWGLDQIPDNPGWEQSWQAPAMEKPGLYIYWVGDTIHMRARDMRTAARIKMHLYATVDIVRNEGFQVDKTKSNALNEVITESSLEFLSPNNGSLVLFIGTRGGPISFSFDEKLPLSGVFIGSKGVTPSSHTLTLSLLDRHAMAWADFNDDGQLDLFINRGGMGGSLRKFPDHVRADVKDELLVSKPDGSRFKDMTRETGIEKQDCSGRHAKWVDFNQDGRLDLFINCLDRGNVAGSYGKQLYEQTTNRRLVNVAAEHGLDIPQHELIDFAWFDADGDGDMDMLSHEDTGYYLYRNQGGKFSREFIYRGKFERADAPRLAYNTLDYWQFDGKLSLADYDSDGDLDVFVASKNGNVLLVNEGGGRFRPVDPASVGLPRESVAAAWVDYDNDGHPDLHLVPEGLFRQNSNHKFEATGFLSLPEKKYQAAIVNWFDRNNDGRMDAVIALEENHSLWRWWQMPFKSQDVKGKDDRFTWMISGYRNVGPTNHWLQLNLIGSAGNRQAIGAQVTVSTPAGPQMQTVGASEGSYLSQGHYRLYFGLGNQQTVPLIKIRWPNGHAEELRNVKVDQLLAVRQDR